MPAPSEVERPDTSRDSAVLARLLTRSHGPFVPWNWNCCPLLLLQANCWIAVPFAVPPLRASTHLLLPLLTTLK